MEDQQQWRVDHEFVRRFELRVQHDQYLAWNELQEIIEVIDAFIKDEAFYYFDTRYGSVERRYYSRPLSARYGPWAYTAPEQVATQALEQTSFVSIEGVSQGSAIFWLIIGGIVSYPAWALGVGMKRSRIGREFERLGKAAGDLIADNLEPLNDRLEEWSEENQRLRGKETTPTLKITQDTHEAPKEPDQ